MMELTVYRMQVEYMLIDINASVPRATLLLGQDEVLNQWNEITRDASRTLW